jgi:hypothetical protein
LRIVRRIRTDRAPFYWDPRAYGLNENRGLSLDLMVDTGMTHLVVTQPVGPLSQRHATIVGAMGDQTCCPFLVSRKCNIGKHEVRHEFIFLIALWP